MTVPGEPRPDAYVIAPTAASRLPGDEPQVVTVETARVEWRGRDRAAIRDGRGVAAVALVGGSSPGATGQARTVEVIVGGWRFELDVEDARRRELRERATRIRATAPGAGGPLEIRAMIPGRVVAVAVAPGDVVAAGQTLLVVEAMKMQNELRTPRDGTIDRVSVGVGETVDLGDLLLVVT